jgi:two-component system, NtrC family, sensor histidine kinase HydH
VSVDIDLLPACALGWSSQRIVDRADGAWSRMLGPLEPVGRTLQEVLGVAPEMAAFLDEVARRTVSPAVEFFQGTLHGQPVLLRATLRTQEGRASMALLDMSEALTGAPPVQIAALSSSLSHEIRNPLSSVKMAVQTLARNTELSERDQRRLKIANREIRTMERMLGLLSEYGRDLPVRLEELPARALLQEAASLIQPELDERGIQLDLQEPQGPVKVRADVQRLRLVLAQLLLNVAMGLPESSRLEVRLTHVDGACHARVLDPAATVSPEERDKLFEPFGSRLARGAGLSLAALRRAVQSHGGNVEVEPTGEVGAVYTLVLPA